MPQWFRDRAADRVKYPDERWAGDCSSDDATLLQRYDHHVVRIDGRPALLLTSSWRSDNPAGSDRYGFTVSFTYAAGHRAAPAEVQAVVDGLIFKRHAE